MTSILVRVGEGFTERRKQTRLSWSMLHPSSALRLAKAGFKGKILRREVLPKDLWPTKAIVGWGIDTHFFKKHVAKYWGREPYEIYAFTEGGIIGLQSWLKKGLTLSPYSGFYEFIPEDESTRSWEDPEYNPPTLLLDELEVNHRYEIVLTSFYGMPFLRYRPGHLVKVVAHQDEEAGIKLPQLEFHDRIDLAGFTRLDERTLWEAFTRSNLEYTDWIVRQEYEGDKPCLHLYVEFKVATDGGEAARILDEGLKAEDSFYGDLQNMLNIHPLKVSCLSKGTFDRFYEEKRLQGLPLPQRRPMGIRATDSSVEDLIRLDGAGS